MKNFRATFCWRNLIKVIKQKKGKTPYDRKCVCGSQATRRASSSFSFAAEGLWLSKLLKVSRLVLWTSSLFCERKTMCKTCLKCDFLLDPFVVWNKAHYSGNCWELQVSRSSLKWGRHNMRQVQNAGHRSQGTGHRSQVTGHRLQGTGHRSQKTQ